MDVGESHRIPEGGLLLKKSEVPALADAMKHVVVRQRCRIRIGRHKSGRGSELGRNRPQKFPNS